MATSHRTSRVYVSLRCAATFAYRPAFEATTGKSVNFSDANVEVTIVVTGRDAWRTLVFARGGAIEDGVGSRYPGTLALPQCQQVS